MDAKSTIRTRRQREAEHILVRLREILPSILGEYPVEAAYVYGSVAQGTVTSLSDVDVALVLVTPLSSYDQLKLELILQGVIDGALRLLPVDVRVINRAPLTVRGRIIRDGILLYERDRARRVAFEVETRKRYFDFAPTARRLRDAFLQRVHKEGLLHVDPDTLASILGNLRRLLEKLAILAALPEEDLGDFETYVGYVLDFTQVGTGE
jgi:predicted nucleotidyltransferase